MPREPEPFPAVPRADFVLFKRACRALLDDDELTAAGAEMDVGYLAVVNHIAGRRPSWRQEIQHLFEELLVTAAGADQALCRLRGAQTALLHKKMTATFDADRIPGLHAENHHSALDADSARRLREYSSTRLACAGALALATRQPPSILGDLTVADLRTAANSTRSHLNSERFPLPGYTAAHIRAHLHHRDRQGATNNAPLFVAPSQPDQPIRPRQMQHLIGKVARHSHLRLNADPNPHAQAIHPLTGELELHALP